MRKCLFLTFALVVLITGVSFAQTDQAIQSIPSTIHISNFTTDTYFSTSDLNSTNAKTQQRYNVIENGVVIAVARVTSVSKQNACLRVEKNKLKTANIKNYQLTFLDYKPVLLSHSEIKSNPVSVNTETPENSATQTTQTNTSATLNNQDIQGGVPSTEKSSPTRNNSTNNNTQKRSLSETERGVKIVDLGKGKYRVYIIDQKRNYEAFVKYCEEHGLKYKKENWD